MDHIKRRDEQLPYISDERIFEERAKLINEIFGRETKAWIEPPFYFCYGYNIELGDNA